MCRTLMDKAINTEAVVYLESDVNLSLVKRRCFYFARKLVIPYDDVFSYALFKMIRSNFKVCDTSGAFITKICKDSAYYLKQKESRKNKREPSLDATFRVESESLNFFIAKEDNHHSYIYDIMYRMLPNNRAKDYKCIYFNGELLNLSHRSVLYLLSIGYYAKEIADLFCVSDACISLIVKEIRNITFDVVKDYICE